MAESKPLGLEKLISEHEYEVQQYLRLIEQEEQIISSLEKDTENIQEETKRLEAEITQLDEECVRWDKQYNLNMENSHSLKRTNQILTEQIDAMTSKQERLQLEYQEEKKQHAQQLEHYSTIWKGYHKIYESRPKIKAVRKAQQMVEENRKKKEEKEALIKQLEEKIWQLEERRNLRNMGTNDFIVRVAQIGVENLHLRKLVIKKRERIIMKRQQQTEVDLINQNCLHKVSELTLTDPVHSEERGEGMDMPEQHKDLDTMSPMISMLGYRPDDSKTMQSDSVSLDNICVQFIEESPSTQVQQEIQPQECPDTERNISELSVLQITYDDIAVDKLESPSKVSMQKVPPRSHLPQSVHLPPSSHLSPSSNLLQGSNLPRPRSLQLPAQSPRLPFVEFNKNQNQNQGSVTIHLENPKKEMQSNHTAPQPVIHRQQIQHHERPQTYMQKPQQRIPSAPPVRQFVPQHTLQDVRVSVPQSKDVRVSVPQSKDVRVSVPQSKDVRVSIPQSRAQPVQNQPNSVKPQEPQINRSQISPRPHVQPPRLPAVQSRLPVLSTSRMPSLGTDKPSQPVYCSEVKVPKLSSVADQDRNPVIGKANCPELGKKIFHPDGTCTYFMKMKDPDSSSPRVDQAQKSQDITKMSPEKTKTTETALVGSKEFSSPFNFEKHRRRVAEIMNKSPGVPANYLAPVKRTFSEVEDSSQEMGNDNMQLFGQQAPVTDFSILSFGGKGDMSDKENKKTKFDWTSTFESIFNTPVSYADVSDRTINEKGADSPLNLFASFGSEGPVAAETKKSVTEEDTDSAINFFSSCGSKENNLSEEVRFNFNFDECTLPENNRSEDVRFNFNFDECTLPENNRSEEARFNFNFDECTRPETNHSEEVVMSRAQDHKTEIGDQTQISSI